MNKSDIEWTDYTFNPVTGCYHTCPYCYARRGAKRFAGDVRLNLQDERIKKIKGEPYPLYELDEPFVTLKTDNSESLYGQIPKYVVLTQPTGFAPMLHRYRLDRPQNVKNGGNIFVGSNCDLFGDWVPDEWIKEAFRSCAAASQHRYMFLTKNPARYLELAEKGMLPKGDNYWYGTSATDCVQMKKAECFGELPGKYRTFLSIEPLLEDVTISEAWHKIVGAGSRVNSWVKWIIVGAENGNQKGKIVPKREWVEQICEFADKSCVPVFMKKSLLPIVGEENMRRQFPEGLKHKTLSTKLTEKLFSDCMSCGKTLRKSDMTAILTRRKRGETPKTVGYYCEDCLTKLKKGADNENS